MKNVSSSKFPQSKCQRFPDVNRQHAKIQGTIAGCSVSPPHWPSWLLPCLSQKEGGISADLYNIVCSLEGKGSRWFMFASVSSGFFYQTTKLNSICNLSSRKHLKQYVHQEISKPTQNPNKHQKKISLNKLLKTQENKAPQLPGS